MSGVIHKKDVVWERLGDQRSACGEPFVKVSVQYSGRRTRKTVEKNESVVERWADVTCPKCLAKRGGK